MLAWLKTKDGICHELSAHFVALCSVYSVYMATDLGVYKQWNGLLDWNTGMDYWNGLLE